MDDTIPSAPECATLYQTAFDENPIASFTLDAQGRVLFWNKACARLTGLAAEEVVGTSDVWKGFFSHPRPVLAQLLLSAHHPAASNSCAASLFRYTTQIAREGLFHSINGKQRYLVVQCRLLRDEGGAIVGCVESLADCTDSKIYQRQFVFNKTHDALTGLPNRSLLEENLSQSLHLAHRAADFVSVFWIQLQEYESISIALCDEDLSRLLETVSRQLLSEVRAIDTLAYFGNGAFVVVASKFRQEEYIPDLAHRLRDAASFSATYSGKSFKTVCQIGVSIFPRNGVNAETLLTKAKQAAAGVGGKKGVLIRFASEELNEKYLLRLNLEDQLKGAIKYNELSLHYQPKASLRSGRMTGMEALLRWNNPKLGSVSPALFIPLAETLGLIEDIGEWVFKSVCQQYQKWSAKHLSPPPISLNLSGGQLRNRDFVFFAGDTIRKTGVPIQMLELEVTETAMLGSLDSAQKILEELKGMGFSISLDDFGTEYSSLSYLRQLPIDKIKIDRSFVSDITHNPNSAAIIKATRAMAEALGHEVIAEGVETEGQLRFLEKIGCDEIQGYFYSKPLPPDELERFLSERPVLPVAATAAAAKRILLLDDDPGVLATLGGLLEDNGYAVETAGNAEDGFFKLAQQDISVVITDLVMDGLDGASFLARIKKLYPQTVRIAFTGRQDVAILVNAVNKGSVFKFFLKPWSESAVLNIVEEAFQYHRFLGKPKNCPS